MNALTDVLLVITAYAVGFALSLIVWQGTRRIFGAYVFQRHNYRDVSLPTGVGILLPVVGALALGVFMFAAGAAYASGPRWTGGMSYAAVAVLYFATSFAFLGFVDDLGGVGESGGFRGHFRSLAAGRVTTGMVKLVGGALVAVAFLVADEGRLDAFRDAALICLAANLANLFDRAPGRVIKIAQVAFVALVAAARDRVLAPVAVVAGAGAGLLGPDLREAFMLGDAGSNVLGAVLGLGVVVTSAPTVRWVVLVVLLVLNLASEFVSFSRVIDATPPLRWFDRLGSPYRPR